LEDELYANNPIHSIAARRSFVALADEAGPFRGENVAKPGCRSIRASLRCHRITMTSKTYWWTLAEAYQNSCQHIFSFRIRHIRKLLAA
jgi:hypothetical protein